MVSVARAIDKILEDKPFMQEALAKGLINYAALADDLQKGVEQELGKKVKHAAVMMALRRASEKLETKFDEKKFDKLTDLTVQSNLFILTLRKTPDTLEAVRGMHKIVNVGEDLLTITEGVHEIAVISNMTYLEDIKKTIEKKNRKDLKSTLEKVASLTICIPKSYLDVSGFYFMTMRKLAWANINVVEIVSTYTEMTLIFFEEDVMKAYDVLRR